MDRFLYSLNEKELDYTDGDNIRLIDEHKEEKILNMIRQSLPCNCTDVTVGRRACVGATVYRSLLYTKRGKTNSYIVQIQLHHNQKRHFMSIDFFEKCQHSL
ncbi:unnamed protein product, partial [Didymodactylos carnosus]